MILANELLEAFAQTLAWEGPSVTVLSSNEVLVRGADIHGVFVLTVDEAAEVDERVRELNGRC